MEGHLAASTPRRKGKAYSTAGRLQHVWYLLHTPVITPTKRIIADTLGVNKTFSLNCDIDKPRVP